MRLVEVAAVVVFLGGCAAVGRALLFPRRREERWEVEHRFEGTARRVFVRRGAEREPVGSVWPEDPDYEEAFMRLMDRARERAAALNGER